MTPDPGPGERVVWCPRCCVQRVIRESRIRGGAVLCPTSPCEVAAHNIQIREGGADRGR